jgi:membrane protease YdiL (CAAX protease family)
MSQRRKRPGSSAPRTSAAPAVDPSRDAASLALAPEPLRPFIAPDVAARFWPVLEICVVACAGLGIAQFVGDASTYLQAFSGHWSDATLLPDEKRWWVTWTAVGFLILPLLYMLVRRGRTVRLRDCNLGWRGFREHVWIYVALYAAVFPVIYLVSWSPSFYQFYPMYPLAGRSVHDLLLWESLYAVQFVALEFCFRGFLVGGLGRYLGVLSVPVAVMPYMMLHFSKPWPEAYAAIFAGLILGWLAWKTKSIWGGVFIHSCVAVSMDLLALSHKNQLPW